MDAEWWKNMNTQGEHFCASNHTGMGGYETKEVSCISSKEIIPKCSVLKCIGISSRRNLNWIMKTGPISQCSFVNTYKRCNTCNILTYKYKYQYGSEANNTET